MVCFAFSEPNKCGPPTQIKRDVRKYFHDLMHYYYKIVLLQGGTSMSTVYVREQFKPPPPKQRKITEVSLYLYCTMNG